MRRTVLPIAACLAAVTACSSNAPAVSTGSDPSANASASASALASASAQAEEDVFPADQALVRTLYYDLSQSYNQGLDAAAEFTAKNNYPEFAYSPTECREMFAEIGFADSYSMTAVPDVNSMALDPGWAMPDTQYAGLVPEGRTYILPVAISEADPSVGYSDSATFQVHVTARDGAAYFFRPCELLI